MPARRVPALALPVDAKAGVFFRGYENRTPLLTIATGGPALLVTLTLPEQLEAGHVQFARQLACQAWAYAVAVERHYRPPGDPVLARAGGRRRHLDPRSRPPECGPARGPAGGDGMTTLTSSAYVEFGADQAPEVNASVRLRATSRMYCHTYPDSAPVVSITDAPVKVSISVPGPDRVTGADVERARQLAALVARYVAELEQLAAEQAGPGPDDAAGAGGVMASSMRAGRLELVPPAAPGFSSHGKEEVTSVCAR